MMKSSRKEKLKVVGKVISRTFLSIFILFLAVFLFNKTTHFPKTQNKLRYPEKFKEVSAKYLDLATLSTKGSFALPGLEETDMAGMKCSAMTPQGICTTGRYILVTAYCRGKQHKVDLASKIYKPTNIFRLAKNLINEQEKYEHRSVIYVIDKKTKDYLTTLCLSDMNHVGGITFDGNYVWIAKSSDYELSAINLKTINAAVKKKRDFVNVDYDVSVVCDRMASFVTYFDNRLWVGFCNGDTKGNGVLDGFTITKEDGEVHLMSSKEISIPYNANGAVFARIDGDVCLAVSLSGGRNNNSKICLYQVDLSKNSNIQGFVDHGKYIMPPLMEEICLDGKNIYYIFESGSSAYSTVEGYKTSAPVDRICVGDVQNLFYWKNSDYIDEFEGSKTDSPSEVSDSYDSMNLPNYVYTLSDEGDTYIESEEVVEKLSSKKKNTQSASVTSASTFSATEIKDSGSREKSVKMLYNPDTAEFAFDISSGIYSRGLDEMISDKISSYGYMQIYNTSNFGGYQFAKRVDEGGSSKYYKAYGRAVIGVKKVYFNKKIRYCFVIAFQGVNLNNLVTDADNEEYLEDSHDGQINIYRNKRLMSQQLHYKYSSNGVNRGFDKLVNKFLDNTKNYKFLIDKKRVSLKDVLSNLGKDDSKYRLIVTGYGAGGTMADILVGEKLVDGSGYEKNVVAYTFGASGCINDERAAFESVVDNKYKNIINYQNADDTTRYLCGNLLGKPILYGNDSAFKKHYYKRYAAKSSKWWSQFENAVKTDNIAHSYETYEHSMNGFKLVMWRYVPYNTKTRNNWGEDVYLTANCFRNFEKTVTVRNNAYVKDGVEANLVLRRRKGA